ncbi:MAG: peptidoglycan DL-endopeptidase CwlO [Acidobacteriota bacterium]|nr:peptidoglycan DL-endopeptidase CwlO [Acidobacteriota bacterium]
MNGSMRRVENIIIGLLVLLLLAMPCCRFEKGPENEPEKVWGLRGKMVALAKSLVGLPYHYGGQEIDGFDCSGFIYYVYDCFGVKLPRTAEGQADLKEKIKLKYAQPADILVFKFGNRWHTALYIGGNSFIHAPERNERLRVESLNDFWKDRLEYVIQVIEE